MADSKKVLDKYKEESPLLDHPDVPPGESWITPYRKEWIRHTSGQEPITDPVRRKELQDIILYPERTGLGPV